MGSPESGNSGARRGAHRGDPEPGQGGPAKGDPQGCPRSGRGRTPREAPCNGIRVVLDTNVIVSATLIRGGNEDQILRVWQRGDFDLVLSPPILEDTQETGDPVAFEPNKNLTARVERAVEAVLQREGHLTYPALLCELGVLTKQDLEAWRAGRVPYLEKVIRTNLTRLSRIQTAVRRMARARNWKRTVTGLKRGRRYSKTSHPVVEEEYAAYYRPVPPPPPAA